MSNNYFKGTPINFQGQTSHAMVRCQPMTSHLFPRHCDSRALQPPPLLLVCSGTEHLLERVRCSTAEGQSTGHSAYHGLSELLRLEAGGLHPQVLHHDCAGPQAWGLSDPVFPPNAGRAGARPVPKVNSRELRYKVMRQLTLGCSVCWLVPGFPFWVWFLVLR
eukprot:452839-Rhodomonas_salina.1